MFGRSVVGEPSEESLEFTFGEFGVGHVTWGNVVVGH
jgi:hypothetical protein